MDNCVELSKRILTDLLLTLSNAELVLESLRIEVCAIPDFTIHAAFRKIDRQRLGYLTAFDLIRFVRTFTTDVDEEDCRRVIAFFDTDGDGALCMQE
jgi:Ca2+-binding EF-hand superfamily protein